MRNVRAALLLMLLQGFCSSPSIYAHHGNAEYNMKNKVTLVGEVTALQLANPHSTVAFDIKDQNGNISLWVV